jgi:hypothetical protein
LSARWTLGRPLGGPRFDELLSLLGDATSDEDLDRAAMLWPEIETAIIADPSR